MEQLSRENTKPFNGKSGIYYYEVAGHSYVGSSVNIGHRLNCHIWALLNNRHRNKFIQNCFNKYSISAFTFKILELCPKDIRIEREKYYIDLLKPDLNVCDPVTLSRDKPEYIERQRKIKKEYYLTHEVPNKIPVYQYTISGEYMTYFSSATEAAKFYNVCVTAIVAATSGRSKTCAGYQWRKEKNDSIPSCIKEKVKKGKLKLPPKPGNKKRIYRYSFDGTYLDSFESASLADRTLNIHGCSVVASGNGPYRSVGGFLWSYEKVDKMPPYENHSKDAKKVAIVLTEISSGQEHEFGSVADAVRCLFPNAGTKFNSLCATVCSCARGKGKTIKGKYIARYK